MRLNNMNIIVTGSTNGIGAAMARRFVAEGARVLIHGRQRQAGETLLEELGDAAALHIDDVSDPNAAERIRDAALSAFGSIHALANNAAVSTRSTLESTSAEFWDHLMAINLRAPMLMIKATIFELEKTEGAILNTGSVVSHMGLPQLMDYSVSKGGLTTLTRNLAMTLAERRVRVNQMNIGWTLTPNEHQLKLSEGLPENWLEEVPKKLKPSGHLLTPEQIATAAVYWIGPESRPVTGSVFELEQYPIIGRIPLS